MSEIDQAFIKAYEEARATPPARRPVVPGSFASPQYAQQTRRLDGPHLASHDVQGHNTPAMTPRVPTPHLHLAARGAAWLERPQPQLVAAVTQEFVAEESHEIVQPNSAIDPWIVPASTPPASMNAPRAMGPGFGGPTTPKTNATPATPETFAVYSGAIKPIAPPASALPQSLPVRPVSSAPWSPTANVAGPKKKLPTNERIEFVEKHTDELTQQLASVAHTLAMLEGDAPTEICLDREEVMLLVRSAETDQAALQQQPLETLESKIAELAPPAKKPELKIATTPIDVGIELGVQAAEPIAEPLVEVVEIALAPPVAAPPAPKVAAAAVVEEIAPVPTPVGAVEKFQPQWEVDQFQWPDVLDRLRDGAHDAIAGACDAIQNSCASGQNVLAITGVEEATGSTTLLLALGRELAKRGMKVAIVDADFDRPTLAERTGLRIQHGWEATLTGSLPLEEVTVASLQDGVTLVPLVARQGVSSTMASLHAAKHLRRLREHFDVVLIDGGVGSENIAALATATADDALDFAVVLTVDQRRSEPAATSEVVSRLRHCGIDSIQLGETFVSA